MSTIVLVSRRKTGKGGIQRYQNDLYRALCELGTHKIVQTTPLRAITTVRALHTSDVVHCTDFTLVAIAYVLRFCTKANISITACGLDVVWKPWIYQLYIRFFAPRMRSVVCISHATADTLTTRGVDPSKIAIIPCGIFSTDSQVYLQRNSVPVLLTVGRLVKRKGVEWFLESVFPLLIQKYPMIQYYIVGNGKRKKAIEKIIRSKGLSSNVHLLSHVEDAERNALIQQAHVFVMPNIQEPFNMEGFGIVCIEASIRGLQVAASRTEGIQDAVIEGKTGLFFRPHDSSSAVEKISTLLESPLDPQSVSLTTQQRYDWSILSKMYAEKVFT